MTEEKAYLCRLQDLTQQKSRGFTVPTGKGELQVLVIRHAGEIYGYLNRCPHTGVSLDWMPDQFLDQTGEFIQCSTHGAQFRIADGLCVYGPCSGDALTPVTLLIQQDEIFLQLT